MILHKKLSVALLSIMGIIYSAEEFTTVQLASGGNVVVTFDNEHQSVRCAPRDNQMVPSLIMLPSFGLKGTVMKSDYTAKKIAAGYLTKNSSGNVADIIDIETQKVERSLKNITLNEPYYYGISVRNLSWSQDGNLIGVCPGMSGPSIPFWVVDKRADSKECFRLDRLGGLYTAVLEPQGENVAAGYTALPAEPKNALVRLFDMQGLEDTVEFEVAEQYANVWSIVFSKDGSSHAAIMHTQGACLIKDNQSGPLMYTINTPDSVYTTGVFNDDATRCALAEKNKIHIIDLETMKTLKTIPYDSEFAHQIDWQGNTLAAACGDGIKTWDMVHELQD